MDAGRDGGKFQIRCPFLPRALELMLSWSGQHSWPLFLEVKVHRAGRSAFSELGFGAVPSQGPSFPMQSLERPSFLGLGESGETQWGQGPLLILLPVTPWIIRDPAVPKLREGKKAEPRSWSGGGKECWQTE